jgi:hypothetical protein
VKYVYIRILLEGGELEFRADVGLCVSGNLRSELVASGVSRNPTDHLVASDVPLPVDPDRLDIGTSSVRTALADVGVEHLRRELQAEDVVHELADLVSGVRVH